VLLGVVTALASRSFSAMIPVNNTKVNNKKKAKRESKDEGKQCGKCT
jgi:hypothetical protein